MDKNNETNYVIEKIKEHDQKFIFVDGKFETHEKQINELDRNQIESSALLKAQYSVQKSLTDSVKEFTGTTNDLKLVMINIQNSLDNNHKEVQNNVKEVQDLKNTLSELNKKIEDEKEKSTIDIRDVNKQRTYSKLLKIGGITIGISTLIAFAAAFVKFMQMAQQFETVFKAIK